MNNDCLDPTLDYEAEAADILQRTVEAVRPALPPTDDEWAALLAEVGATHAEYCATVSPANMAASIETCAWLLHLCRRLGARRVLDLGSGISSWLLRHHAATAAYPVAVVSVDDDVAWLTNTADFLADRFPVVDGLMTLDEFNAVTHEPFDVAFHDIAGGDLRSQMMAAAAALVAPGGVIVFDDCHHDGHRRHAAAAAQEAGLWLVSLHQRTLDKFHRFAMAAMSDPFGEDWFSEASQSVIAELARSVHDVPGMMLEIGSWTGRSTCALAKAIHPRTLHAVDTWAGSPGEITSQLAPQRDVFAQWKRNIDAFTDGNVIAHRMDWREFVPTITEPLAFVFIDAEHTEIEVADNIAAVLPLLSPGGIICGDDVLHPPVRQGIVRHLRPVDVHARVGASVWWWQK